MNTNIIANTNRGVIKFIKNLEITKINKLKPARILFLILMILLGSIIVSGTVSAAGLANSPQPKYQHNNQNTGQSQYFGPQTNNTKWTNMTLGISESSITIGSNDTLYFDSFDNELGDLNAPVPFSFYALNSDGTVKWKYTGLGAASSAAISDDGTIYVGGSDGIFYALNANGTLKWNYSTGTNSLDFATTIGSDGTIYTGSRDGKFLDALNPNGTLQWTYPLQDGSNGVPAIGADGTIYITCWDNNLYAINPNGTLKWQYSVGPTGNGLSSPAIGQDGTIYFGGDSLYAIKPNGTLKWNYTANSPGVLGISSNGTIYFESFDSTNTIWYLNALTPNETLLWSHPNSYPISTATIGADGTIYLGAMGPVQAINPDGTLKWTYYNRGITHAPPVIGSDGSLYIINSNGYGLYAIEDFVATNIRTGVIYSTIQNAINDPNTINGDTISVYPGSYSENVLINKNIIINTLGSVTIQPRNPNQPVFNINSLGSGATIQGFNITGSSNASGLSLSGANNCNVRQNNITHNLIGILNRGNNNFLSQNNINNNTWAGICADSVDATEISINTISKNQEGIYLLNCTYDIIQYNSIYENAANGINIQGGLSHLINGNNIINNGVGNNGNGIILKNTYGNTLENNDIEYNGWSGIVLDGSHNNDIGLSGQGNTISSNDNGLVLYNLSHDNSIQNNIIQNNHYNGLELYWECEDNNILMNNFSGNDIIGILVQYCNNNTIDHNTIENGKYNGIVLDTSCKNYIENNHINNVGNTLDMGGIGLLMVQSSDQNTISNNEFDSNIWTNIVLDHCSENQITNNIINGTHTSQQGILLLHNCNQNDINGNSIYNNTAVGISLQKSSNNNDINHNHVSNNGIIGILIDTSNNNTLYHNTIESNGWAGTCISNSIGNTMTENNYLSNPEQAYDNGINNYDNGFTGNYYSDWTTTDPRLIDGGSNVDHFPSLYQFYDSA